MDKDATASARVVMVGLVTRLLVAAFVRQVSLAINVKTVARQVCEGRTVFLHVFDESVTTNIQNIPCLTLSCWPQERPMQNPAVALLRRSSFGKGVPWKSLDWRIQSNLELNSPEE